MAAKKRAGKTAAKQTKSQSTTSQGDDSVVFLNTAISARVRIGLNKLVESMGKRGQRAVLEQLILDELHRRNMRLPRVA